MMVLNRVILIGRLATEPELRYTQTGVPVTTFRIAVQRPFTNQQGDRETDFFPIVTWRKLAEVCAHNLNKGRLVAVEGRLQNRSFTARDGSRRWVTEVVADDVRFLDWPKDNKQQSFDTKPGSDEYAPVDALDVSDDFSGDLSDEDIPF